MKLLALALPAALLLSACSTKQTPSPQPVQTDPKRPVVALVLGGGGTRGFAHVGVIQALEKNGIRPDMVVGTSVGAMVGALYASGKTADELKQLAITLNEKDIIELSPSKQGLIDGTRLRRYVNQQVNHRPIGSFAMRYAAVATELPSKTTVVFDTGEAGIAVQASTSVPKLFIAPRIPENGGKKYIDGSQSTLVPARIARNLGADVVISVDLMTPAQTTTDDQAAQSKGEINITRTDTAISAKWGDKTLALPIDLTQLDKATAELPFELPLGSIVGNIIKSIPTDTTISLPDNLPKNLPTSPADLWQLFDQAGKNLAISADDVAASDVLIRPLVTEVSPFDTSKRLELINAGKIATIAQLPAINTAIDTANNRHSGK